MISDRSASDDPFLILALREGQEKAFDFIFRQYYKALCAQANLYTQDLDLAQSLVQDCFVKLWESRAQATEIESLSSWLTVMVRNRCVDYIRRYKRETIISKAPDQSDMNQDSDRLLLSHEFEERLVQALSQLPGRCREAFEYSRFEHLTYAEIASKMNVSVKAVEALVSRSLKILRVELKDYLPLVILLYRMTS
jgi:RNA polymerase sigma-70 factor (ECF subfamily)